jgi:hypothetical protein
MLSRYHIGIIHVWVLVTDAHEGPKMVHLLLKASRNRLRRVLDCENRSTEALAQGLMQ